MMQSEFFELGKILDQSKKIQAELTDFPKIFRECYWGNHTADGYIGDDIVTHRNSLIRTEGIKKYLHSPPQYPWKLAGYSHEKTYADFWSHMETYDAGDKYILLTNPYAPITAVPPLFQRTPNLYSAKATSWIARIDKRARNGNYKPTAKRDKSPKRN